MPLRVPSAGGWHRRVLMVDFAGPLGLDKGGVSAEFYTAIVVNYIRRPSMNDKAVKALTGPLCVGMPLVSRLKMHERYKLRRYSVYSLSFLIRYVNKQQQRSRYADEHSQRHGKYRQIVLNQTHRQCP